MKCKVFVFLLSMTLIFGVFLRTPPNVSALELNLSSVSGILMEAHTGEILYEHNADEKLAPASVTKVMSMLLIMEALETGRITLNDDVVISEYAASMGGSQIFLEVGEQMSVDELLKAIVVSSANDATVALAEHTYGSIDAFVTEMNKRAASLGMTNTTFKNATGLDEDGHVTTARDIAIMSRELLKYEKIFDYTTIWIDTVRNGEFGLSNTNKLIRFYAGANGLKTGSTGIAKYSLSATALRNNMQLIAVVLAAPTSNDRFADAKKLLDYGFATYAIAKTDVQNLTPVKITGGITDTLELTNETSQFLVRKGREAEIKIRYDIPEVLAAPVKLGQKIGTIEYLLDDEVIGTVDVVSASEVERIGFLGIFGRMLGRFFMIR